MCNALGATTAEALAALSEGRSGLGPSPLELPFEATVGAVRATLDAPPPSLARYDSRLARITLRMLDEVAHEVASAVRRWGPDRVAVVLGTSTGGLAETERAYDHHRATGALPERYDVERQHAFHAFAECLQKRLELRGPCLVVSTACSSSAKVLATAQRLMRAGVADAALVGGVDTLCQTTLRGFHALEILAAGACKPFSAARGGINLGEGGALLLVEREGAGRARLLGVGESADAYHMSTPHPEGLGARAAMAQALARAGLAARDVDHVNAHGTGTMKNDVAECRAVEAVFGRDVPVVSTKGYTGHLLGACGAVEAAFAVAALEGGWIPASLGADPQDPEVHVRINTERLALACRVVVSNSFGFGGSNASVVLGAER